MWSPSPRSAWQCCSAWPCCRLGSAGRRGRAGVVEAVLLGLVVGVVAHFVSVSTLLSSVTLPLRARARPSILAPVLREIEVSAMIVPTNRVLEPRVADVPTCQKTWQLCASFSSTTRLLDAVVRPAPIWKMNTASGSPFASRVREPVSSGGAGGLVDAGHQSPPAELCTDGRVGGLAGGIVVGGLQVCLGLECLRVGAWMTPPTLPGGKPTTAVPGWTPALPLSVLGPVFVTVWPARTE